MIEDFAEDKALAGYQKLAATTFSEGLQNVLSRRAAARADGHKNLSHRIDRLCEVR